MQRLIGQDKLYNQLLSATQQGFPKSSILIGPNGCGKHTLASWLAIELQSDLVFFDLKADLESINDLDYSTKPTLLVLDLTEVVEKQQNQFLKLVEEPPKNTRVLILTVSEANVLPTLLNRCVKFYFAEYASETLMKLYPNIHDPEIFYICRTPGQLLDIEPGQIKKLHEDCLNFISFLHTKTFAEAISLSTAVNYKEDYNKYDFEFFLKGLETAVFKSLQQSSGDVFKKRFAQFNTIKKLQISALRKGLNREAFIINLLSELWRLEQ